MKKYLSNFGFSIIVFIFMSLFLSLEISKANVIRMQSLEQNNFFDSDAVTFHISSEEMTTKKFYEVIKNEKDIMIQRKVIRENDIYGSAVYMTKLTKDKPNIIEGRYFTEEDFKENSPVVVIGKDILERTTVINNIRYFTVGNVKFKVIGIMGGKDSNLNSQFIVNLNVLLMMHDEKIDPNSFYEVQWLDKGNGKVGFENFCNLVKGKYNNTNFYEDDSITVRNPVASYLKIRSIYILAVVVIFILNIISIAAFHIDKRKKEIGVLKAFGVSNMRIIRKIILEYELVSIACFTVGLMIHYLITKIYYHDNLYYRIYGQNILLIIILSTIIGIIASIFPVIKLIRIEASEVMKG